MELLILPLYIPIIIIGIIVAIVSSNKKKSYHAPVRDTSYYKPNTYVPANSNSCYRKPPMPPYTAQYISGAAQEIQSNINTCRNINKRIPKIITENEIQVEISKIPCEHYIIKPYATKTTEQIKKLAKKEAKKYARQNASKNIFKRPSEIKTIVNNKLNDFIILQEDKEKNNEKKHLQNEEQVRIKKDAEYKTKYDDKCRPFIEKIIDDDTIINSNITKLYSSSCDKDLPPFNFSGTYSKNLSNTCSLKVELPNSDYIEHRKLTSTGKVSSVMRSTREIVDEYFLLINGLLLYITAKIFNVNTCIKTIHIEAEKKELDSSTGRIKTTNEGYYSIDRNSFSNINFSLADPSAAISKYKTYSKPVAKPSTVKSPMNNPPPKGTYKAPKNNPVPITKKTNSPYTINLCDELLPNSLNIIRKQIAFLLERYGKDYFTQMNQNRLISAIKDLISKNEAEKELFILMVNKSIFVSFVENSNINQAEKLLREILTAINLSDIENFINYLRNSLR